MNCSVLLSHGHDLVTLVILPAVELKKILSFNNFFYRVYGSELAL